MALCIYAGSYQGYFSHWVGAGTDVMLCTHPPYNTLEPLAATVIFPSIPQPHGKVVLDSNIMTAKGKE